MVVDPTRVKVPPKIDENAMGNSSREMPTFRRRASSTESGMNTSTTAVLLAIPLMKADKKHSPRVSFSSLPPLIRSR